jgi:hypothetical protein
MNVILLITILATFSNGIVSTELREIEGLPSLEVCEYLAEVAREDADRRDLPEMTVTTVCSVGGDL